MWQPLSLALEILGRIRLRLNFFSRTEVSAGSPLGSDAQDSQEWRKYLSGERLFEVWGPLPDSAWASFQSLPLFVALDRIEAGRIGPTEPPRRNGSGAEVVEVPRHAAPGAPAPVWVASDALTIADLPGRWSVEVAAWLVTAAHCQPVCTFNNWPNAKGLLKPELILAELLRWASTIAEARREMRAEWPPLWICDSQRLGERAGSPGQFDNRYFLEDGGLPGAAFLKANGIGRVVYVTLDPARAPIIDLDGYFADLESAGVPVRIVDVMDPALALRHWIAGPPRKFSTANFKRSSAGGFGTTVPQPSSGGGG